MEIFKPEYLEIINKIITFEESKKSEWEEIEKKYGIKTGWTWYDVGIHPSKLSKLVSMGVIKIVYKSNKKTEYRLANPDEIKKILGINNIVENVEDRPKKPIKDLFKNIVGHDDIKKTLKLALKSKKPVHVLLIGPPATAKTLFLEEIYNTFKNSEFVFGSTTSSAGLFNLLISKRPKILLIDEIDKLVSEDNLSILLSLMESSCIKKTKANLTTNIIKLETKVFAAGNKDNLPKELSDRFIKLYLREYTRDEFLEVCEKYISNTENVDENLVRYTAEKLWDMGIKSIRNVRNIIRMSGGNKENIEFLLDIMKKYGVKHV